MKRILLTITIIAVAFSVSACTFWNKNDSEGFSFLDNEMDESVSFNENLSNYETLELNIDLTVSDVKIEATNGDTLKYSQKANKVELLAGLSKEDNGDKIILTFKNEENPKLISGSQTSKTVILVPEGIEVIIHSDGDVGDLVIDLDSLTVLEIDASTNVGDIELSANQDQSKLSYIKTTSDVGDIHTVLNGDMNALEKIVAKTATGQIDINLNGSFESEIDVDAKSDVGDITLDFDGTYDDAVSIKVASSVGDMALFVPRKHEIVLEAHTTEFTSNLEIDDMPFTKSKSRYNIEGDKSTFNIDLTVTVGDAAIKYSN
jgi:uncharacterized protein YxeA